MSFLLGRVWLYLLEITGSQGRYICPLRGLLAPPLGASPRAPAQSTSANHTGAQPRKRGRLPTSQAGGRVSSSLSPCFISASTWEGPGSTGGFCRKRATLVPRGLRAICSSGLEGAGHPDIPRPCPLGPRTAAMGARRAALHVPVTVYVPGLLVSQTWARMLVGTTVHLMKSCAGRESTPGACALAF